MIYTSRYGIIMRIVTDDKLPIRLFGRTHFYIIYFTPVLLIRVFWVLSKPDCWIRKMLLPLCPELIWKMEFWISGGVRFQILYIIFSLVGIKRGDGFHIGFQKMDYVYFYGSSVRMGHKVYIIPILLHRARVLDAGFRVSFVLLRLGGPGTVPRGPQLPKFTIEFNARVYS